MSEDFTSQSWNRKRYERNAGFVADLGGGVKDMLAPQAEKRILNLGSGYGKLTQKLVASVAIVLAVDASEEQVKGARDRGQDAHVADAAKLTFKSEFDAVFPNTVQHWVKNADAAIAGVKKALVSGEIFYKSVTASDRVALLDEVREDLAPDLKDVDGKWIVDFVRLRFQDFLP